MSTPVLVISSDEEENESERKEANMNSCKDFDFCFCGTFSLIADKSIYILSYCHWIQ